MLTPALVKNRQFMGASTSLLLFGVGMMGTLFLTVLVFVNLWGYSELEAALAITPVAVTAMLVSPLVGRFSDRLAPRVFGVPALFVMAVGIYSLSTLPPEPSFWAAFWRLAVVGVGVGATFPAVSIGSMGAIRGQELGLGSGIVNTARQVGFAIGIALFVAVFTGAVDDRVSEARGKVSALERESGLSPSQRRTLEDVAIPNQAEPSAERPEPRTPVEERARHVVDEELRDAYGAAFRVGAFVVLLAIPFSWTMRRNRRTCRPRLLPQQRPRPAEHCRAVPYSQNPCESPPDSTMRATRCSEVDPCRSPAGRARRRGLRNRPPRTPWTTPSTPPARRPWFPRGMPTWRCSPAAPAPE